MIRRMPAPHNYWIAVGVLAATVALFVIFDLALFFGWPRGSGGGAVVPSPTPSGTWSLVTPGPSSGMEVQLGANADCGACHVAGGAVLTKPIPVMAHPLEGWTNCTACHADGRLVQTAPGHSGIHKDQCLVCHKLQPATATAAPRPHHVVTGTACITCHGKTAPLPTDMAGRTNCWICHSGTEYEDLFGTPGPDAAVTPGP